jgi:hypothetical protein
MIKRQGGKMENKMDRGGKERMGKEMRWREGKEGRKWRWSVE